MFYERVPLPPEARARIQLDPWQYGDLAEAVEAGLSMQATGQFMTCEQVAETWFREDYEPIVATCVKRA